MTTDREGIPIGRFRKLRGVHIPYARQGLIRFTCLNYRDEPETVQGRIDRLCRAAGGAYAYELHLVMCTPRTIRSISMERHVSESTLYRIRARFYEMWDKFK